MEQFFVAQEKFVDGTTITRALHSISEVLNFSALGLLLVLFAITFVAGKIIGKIMRRFSHYLRNRADASTDLSTVRRLRRMETWTILLITVVQFGLFIFAFYFWWILTHDGGGKSGALIGASAVAVVLIGGVATPLLRDLAFGAGMMAEHWYGVGDLITVEFPKAQGVVESITLRSTKIRGLNGETIWLANQSIQGVSVAQKGTLSVAIELFVNDVDGAEDLITEVNNLLPTGSALLAQTLEITSVDKRSDTIWHITAIGETAPGREWILQTTAIDLMKKLDENQDNPILLSDPVHRFADRETESQFVRAVRNARKPHRKFNYRKLTHRQIMSRAKDKPTGKKPEKK